MYSIEAKELNRHRIGVPQIKGGRYEDPVDGVFKTILRVELPNREMTPPKQERFTKQIVEEQSHAIYSYEFIGVETLVNLQVIDIIRRHTKKICNIVTSAPIKQWEQLHTNLVLEDFQKIFVRRLAANDEVNSNLLGVEAITAEHYQQMDTKLRDKIIFIVDTELSNMKNLKEVNDFLRWAEKIGIKRIMFLANELDLIHYNTKVEAIQRKRLKARRKQIQAVRDKCYDPKLVKEVEVNVELPLMEQTRHFLIKEGYNFDFMKCEFAQDGLWRINPFKNGKMEIMIKTKIISPDNQHVCWKNSAIHTYVKDVKY